MTSGGGVGPQWGLNVYKGIYIDEKKNKIISSETNQPEKLKHVLKHPQVE